MMKKILLLVLFLFSFHLFSEAQVRFGIRGGINDISQDASLKTITDEIGNELLDVGLNKTKIGLVGGLVIQIQLGKFLIQPELLLSSSNYEYEVVDLTNPDFETEFAEERFRYFDIPLLLGYKAGPLRFQVGPEAHIFVNNTSDLIDLEFYKENIDNFTFGWAGNIGLDIWNIMLDVRYEGNLSALGTSFVVGSEEFKFDDRPSRWVFSLGYLF